MSGWPMVRLGEVLTHRKHFIEIDDLSTYKRCRVQLHAQGVVLRDRVAGAEIKTKKQQVCEAGELLVAEIDAKHGGYGIVPDELGGAIVSSHYFLFAINAERLDRSFLDYYIRTTQFFEQVAAQGSTNYAAIRPSHVLDYQIPLPSISEQVQAVRRIDAIRARICEARGLVGGIEKDARHLLISAYRQIAGEAPRRPMGEVAPLVRRPVSVDISHDYPQIAVRSFGKGTFHKPPLIGSEVTWEKPHLVKAGDILISNIKAWEGALAVASAADDGRYGSHRYLTCVPIETVATARFICFHLLSPDGLAAVGEASPGSADRNRTLNTRALAKIPVPVPPFGRQLWFGQLYDQVDLMMQRRGQCSLELDAMLPGILDRAFRGRF